MNIIIGLGVFFIFIGSALKVGTAVMKGLFTIIGSIVGFVLIMTLIPLGIGLLIIPVVVIAIIVAVVKCIKMIF